MERSPLTAEPPAELADFPDFVEHVLREWHAPGAAVAVAQDGAIVLARGFGRRDVERDRPVTPRTRFAIGSCTKAFTTLSLAQLVDEGRLDWDAPVRSYLPTFALQDPVASERITPRDLVSHRSGLPRHDLAWYGSPRSRSELVGALRHLAPSADFRDAWQYQNLLYLTAGYLAGEVAGQSWEELVRRRIFERLGMAGSNFSVAASQESDDFALPYQYQERGAQLRAMPFRPIDEIAPAGAINAGVADMAPWLLLHLNKGRHGEERIVSEGQIAELHAPRMVMPEREKYPELSLPSYGLGWFVRSYRGETVVAHGGNIDGFSALVAFAPNAGVGVVALVNLNGVPVPEILAYRVFDRLLGLPLIDWHGRWRDDRAAAVAAGEQGKAKSASDRVPGTAPSHPLADYAGEFAHPGYGTITIGREGDGLTLRFNAFAGPLRHHHYDSFEYTDEQDDETHRFTFAADPSGEIAAVSAPLEPAVADIVFRRRAPAAMRDPAFLAPFLGGYDLMGLSATVAWAGAGALRLSIPGQPDAELEPRRGTEFRVKGRSGFAVEFQRDASGAVVAALVSQPNALVTAPKTG